MMNQSVQPPINYEAQVIAARDAFFEHAAVGRSLSDMEVIRRAYAFAMACHQDQKRKSGEPYILHPIAVADVVVRELGLDTNSIIASLLHDVQEDCKVPNQVIADKYGKEVAFLVECLTKKKDIKGLSVGKNAVSKQVVNFRKMIMTIQYDIRVLLIKLADRLHNMRTLGGMPLDKQMKITGETDFFYAPLANRLGLYNVKTELENLSFRFRMPEEYSRLERTIQDYCDATQTIVDAFADNVSKILHEAGIGATVTATTRSIYSLWKKMQELQVPLHRLESVHVFDVVFDPVLGKEYISDSEKNQCLFVYALLTNSYTEKVGSFHNYVDNPKANGYQGVHCKFMTSHGSWAEVHIRTRRMDEASVRGCLMQQASSHGGVMTWVDDFKVVLKDIIRQTNETSDSVSFLEEVKTSLWNDDIKVYTPKGKEVTLPKGATALDLAYEVHTQVGNTARYARINGQLCSVATELRRGDRVEIGIEEGALPRKEWLEVVKTYRARKGLRTALRDANMSILPEYIHLSSCCSPMPGDELIGFKPDKSAEDIYVHLRSCPQAIHNSAEHGDWIVPATIPISEKTYYPATIQVTGVDHKGMTYRLLHIISDDWKLNVERLVMETKDNMYQCEISTRVHSSRELGRIINRILCLKGVEEVKRLK